MDGWMFSFKPCGISEAAPSCGCGSPLNRHFYTKHKKKKIKILTWLFHYPLYSSPTPHLISSHFPPPVFSCWLLHCRPSIMLAQCIQACWHMQSSTARYPNKSTHTCTQHPHSYTTPWTNLFHVA